MFYLGNNNSSCYLSLTSSPPASLCTCISPGTIRLGNALSPVEFPVFTEGRCRQVARRISGVISFHPSGTRRILSLVMRFLELVALYLVSRYAPSSLLPASERERTAFFPLAWCRGRRTLIEGERGVSRTRGTVLGVKRLLANLQRANLKNSGAF